MHFLLHKTFAKLPLWMLARTLLVFLLPHLCSNAAAFLNASVPPTVDEENYTLPLGRNMCCVIWTLTSSCMCSYRMQTKWVRLQKRCSHTLHRTLKYSVFHSFYSQLTDQSQHYILLVWFMAHCRHTETLTRKIGAQPKGLTLVLGFKLRFEVK